MSLLVVDGATLGFTNPLYSGTITITPLSLKNVIVKCENNSVYRKIVFTVAGFSGGGITAGTGEGEINGNSTNVLVSGNKIVLDTATTTVTITDANSPFGTLNVEVGIANAGQTTVNGV